MKALKKKLQKNCFLQVKKEKLANVKSVKSFLISVQKYVVKEYFGKIGNLFVVLCNETLRALDTMLVWLLPTFVLTFEHPTFELCSR